MEKEEVKVTNVCSREQKADIQTKVTGKVKHKEMCELIRVKQVTNSRLKGDCLPI